MEEYAKTKHTNGGRKTMGDKKDIQKTLSEENVKN